MCIDFCSCLKVKQKLLLKLLNYSSRPSVSPALIYIRHFSGVFISEVCANPQNMTPIKADHPPLKLMRLLHMCKKSYVQNDIWLSERLEEGNLLIAFFDIDGLVHCVYLWRTECEYLILQNNPLVPLQCWVQSVPWEVACQQLDSAPWPYLCLQVFHHKWAFGKTPFHCSYTLHTSLTWLCVTSSCSHNLIKQWKITNLIQF